VQHTGAQLIPVTLRLAGLAWIVMQVQTIALFARPTPYGEPYLENWTRYFFYAPLYNLIGVVLLATPFLLTGLLTNRRRIPGYLSTWLPRLFLALLVVSVMLDQADHEVMRFMGIHLTVGLLRTYGKIGAWGADVGRSLASDRGGPGLPLLLLVASPAVLWWSGNRVLRHSGSAPARSGLAGLAPALLTLAVLPVAALVQQRKYRRERLQPEVMTLIQELRESVHQGVRPPDLPQLVQSYREEWQHGDPGHAWQFTSDSTYPLLRQPREDAGSSSSPARWNVIYLQLETFRGWDVGLLRPDRAVSPTPFLDSLAASPASAYWTRALSFGTPTVSGFIAGHCSIQPHSRLNVTTTFTFTRLDCLPAELRRQGWHTAFFTAADPDWDGETPWVDRWYDESHFYRNAHDADRLAFRQAADRIRAIGSTGQPFLATVVSISNHYPFQSREPALDLSSSTNPRDAILNTMHYTDAVVREFVERLAGESWFRQTLIVVTGDHGYNLGEHGATAGRGNGWRESIWVPLLIHGAHPRLPAGAHDGVASLLDLAPTLAELLGLRKPTAWQGHSLVHPDTGRFVGSQHVYMTFAETDSFSLVLDPTSGAFRLYQARIDPFQEHDIAASRPEVVERLRRRVTEQQRLIDYLLEVDRVWNEESDRPRGTPRLQQTIFPRPDAPLLPSPH
jgi:hypothetical protein